MRIAGSVEELIRLGEAKEDKLPMMTSKSVAWRLLGAVLVVVPVALLAILGTVLFVAIGALFAWLSPLTFFQSVCVTIGSTLVMMLGVYTVKSGEARQGKDVEFDNDDDSEDWVDEDEDGDEYGEGVEADGTPYFAASESPRSPKTGRNAPCPCGSGKKYKKCCGSQP